MMARIVIVPEFDSGRPMVDPIVLAAIVESHAKSFTAQEAFDNEKAAADFENDVPWR